MKMSKCEWNRDLVHHRLVIKLNIHDRFARLKMKDAIAITTGHRLPVIPQSVSHQFAILDQLETLAGFKLMPRPEIIRPSRVIHFA